MKALEYLKNERGLSEQTLRQFQVGYCPEHVQHELSGRIVMPLFNTMGTEVVAFTSRDWTAEKRYQHWHESFDKSRHLYGFNIAKDAIRKWDKVIIVEGQFDTMCFHAYGLNMTVGLCGTHLSIMHVSLLARYCSEIYFVLDPDQGGKEAKERMLILHAKYSLDIMGIKFIFVELPEGFDPDDYVRKYGSKKVAEMMKAAKAKK